MTATTRDPRSPTPSAEWVEVGDTVVANVADPPFTGTALRIVDPGSLPYVTVRWDNPKFPDTIGRHTITTLHRVKETT